MPEQNSSTFLFGNLILGIALLCLLFMEALWARLGSLAMVLWVVLVAVGVSLIMKSMNQSGDL